jgi:hypothetical protein
MRMTQPTIHHVIYVESDAIQMARTGLITGNPKSIWVTLEHDSERELLDRKLMDLHRQGRIKMYFVGACYHGDDSDVDAMYDELEELSS